MRKAILSIYLPLSIGLLGILACALPWAQDREPDTSTLEWAVTDVIDSDGGDLMLPDGATLHVPASSLYQRAEISLSRVPSAQSAEGGFAYGTSVGNRYEVDLGSADLAVPATLEIPYDPTLVPAISNPVQVFVAYLEETEGGWRFAGGEVDPDSDRISVIIDHASFWEPYTWNWDAWIAVLSKTLKGNLVDLVEAFTLLTEDCPQSGDYVRVENVQMQNVFQGCVDRDDPKNLGLRVVNPKSIFLEVRPVSDGPGYFSPTLLSPGESLRFSAKSTDPSPFVVAAEITQQAGVHLVVHMVLTMLPGFGQFDIESTHVACIAERVGDVSYIASAAEALLVDQDGAAAAEQVSQFYLDADAMGRFVTAADDCLYAPAGTWSLEGIRLIGKSVSTIISATDFIANSIAISDNLYSEVAFIWEPAAARTCPVDDPTFCDFVDKLEPLIVSGDIESILQRTVLLDCVEHGSGFGFDPQRDCERDKHCAISGALGGDAGCWPLSIIRGNWGSYAGSPTSIRGLIYPDLPGYGFQADENPLSPLILITTGDPEWDWVLFCEKRENQWVVTEIIMQNKDAIEFQTPQELVIPFGAGSGDRPAPETSTPPESAGTTDPESVRELLDNDCYVPQIGTGTSAPQEWFDYFSELLQQAGINLEPEPRSFWDLDHYPGLFMTGGDTSSATCVYLSLEDAGGSGYLIVYKTKDGDPATLTSEVPNP